MNFEDLVDMEWMNNNTVVFSEDEDPFKNPLLMSECFDVPAADCSSENVLTTPTILPELGIMPTTEQIKQLIETAKRHLVLREQQQAAEQTSLASTAPPPPVSMQSETIAPEALVKSYRPSDLTSDEMNNLNAATRRESTASLDDSISLEHCAETEGIDIKALSPKERRQLRNKISARNFRVRRKEYITTLEAQIDDHKLRADLLQERLVKAENESKQLRTEIDTLRYQNQHLLQKQSDSTPTSPTASVQPDMNKDIGILGTTTTERYRQENCILVSSAVMPNWDMNAILTQPISSASSDSSLKQAAVHFLLGCYQFYAMHSAPTRACNDIARLEDLYDSLIMGALINTPANSEKRLFCWWDTNNVTTAAV